MGSLSARLGRTVLTLVGGLGALACGGEQPAETPIGSGEAAPLVEGEHVLTRGEENAEERLDRLRSLGYAGFSREVVEEGAPVVHVLERERCAPGYTLVTCARVPSAELVDLEGRVVHAWRGTPGDSWANVELLDDGAILVPVMPARGGRRLDRRSWTGELLWEARGQYHHDVDVTPDGSVATLGNEFRVVEEVSVELDVKDNQLCVLSTDGELVEWASIYDMLATAPELFSFQRVGRMENEERGMIDLLHSNSVEFMRRPQLADRHPLYAPGNVLVSIRHQDTVAIFDWEARELVWAWGQGEISGQHDATILDNGHMLIFDNGLETRASRVIELDPLTRKIVWEYRAPVATDFFTLTRGSSQRLTNGNTLITESDSGIVFEVTTEGDVVWRYATPQTNAKRERATIVSARRYPEEMIERLLGR